MPYLMLCPLTEIDNPGSLGFSLHEPGYKISLFVIRQGDLISAFVNRCPHTGVNLEWRPNQFLDIDNHYIQCATHGALFEPASGLCVRGPCIGQSLERLEIDVRDETLYLVVSE